MDDNLFQQGEDFWIEFMLDRPSHMDCLPRLTPHRSDNWKIHFSKRDLLIWLKYLKMSFLRWSLQVKS